MLKIFREYKKLNLSKISLEIRKYWKKHQILKKNLKFSIKNKFSYILYEGPPSLNGNPGIHHILSRTIKDIFCRYHFLKGKNVFRRAGWDAHGLPVEINVEKKIGINKKDIGKKISIEKYNKFCKNFVTDSMKKWILFTKQMGYWIDIENYFITHDTKYIETIWWLIKKLYNSGFIYQGYMVQPYSPSAGTGLSHHELNMPGAYQNVCQISPYIKFQSIKKTLPKKIKSILDPIFFLSWTTSPWTLPSNTALSIGCDIDYVLIKTYNVHNKSQECFLLSEKSIHRVFVSNKYYIVSNFEDFNKFQYSNQNKIPYIIMEKIKGKDLLYSKYEQLLAWFSPYHKNFHNAFQVIEGDFVNTNEGTGIVHISPTFGSDDFLVSKKYNIPPMLILDGKNRKPVPIVDLQGRFLNIIPYGFGGKYIKNELNPNKKDKFSVDEEIICFLKKKNKVFKTEKYHHFYPYCWRTEKPIFYYPLNSWFIKTTKILKKMIILNKNIKWHSNPIGNKRFEYWIKNIKDWNLSRSRYWGTPLPIWKTKKGDEIIIIGSIKELCIEINKSIKHGFMSHSSFDNFIWDDMSDENYRRIDLHKHILDKIVLVSPKGFPMKRDPDLIDVWFDSGAMPYAQFHYPFENKDLIDHHVLFPSDFISEGSDQTRGWFFTLHAISSMVFNSISYKNVLSTGLILDKNGNKMSKSKGNTIDPFDLIETYSSDAIRWYIIYNSNPWENLKFNVDKLSIITNKFFGTWFNLYSFFSIYANIDGYKYKGVKNMINNNVDSNNLYLKLDRWIISELNTMIQKSDEYYSEYNPTKVTRLIFDFVLNKLSNWYIRLCRRRFWKKKYTKSKISAYEILYQCLITIAKITSPIIPFFSEKIYIDLTNHLNDKTLKSIHFTHFPKYDEKMIDEKLEKNMYLIQKIVGMISYIRKKNNIKNRQPLQRSIVFLSKKYIDISHLKDILIQESNIKEVKFTNSYENLELEKSIKPNYQSLGPKFGKKTKEIANFIINFDQKKITEIEKKKKILFSIQKKNFFLLLEDVKISTKYIKGWDSFYKEDITVALDLRITYPLFEEGFIRDIIRYIQVLRKKYNCEITEKVHVYLFVSQEDKKIIQKYINLICEETLSVYIGFQKDKKGVKVDLKNKKTIYIDISRNR